MKKRLCLSSLAISRVNASIGILEASGGSFILTIAILAILQNQPFGFANYSSDSPENNAH